MLKIYIARHGQNEDNAQGILNGHRDLPLTELGKAQGRELAVGIKEMGLKFDAIYSSPLCRASITAEIVSEEIAGPKPVVMDLLIERDFGSMTGVPIADIEKVCGPNVIKTSTITYFLKPDGAETFPDLHSRGLRALRQIQELHSEGCVLIVAHGDIGKAIYASYYGIGWEEILHMFHFGNCELLLLAEGINPREPHVVRISQYNL